jgi:hypothetical protein
MVGGLKNIFDWILIFNLVISMDGKNIFQKERGMHEKAILVYSGGYILVVAV